MCRSLSKYPVKAVTVQQKRPFPGQRWLAPGSWDDEAKRTKPEATIPLVPGRNEDIVSPDDFDFGIKYFRVTFVMTSFCT